MNKVRGKHARILASTLLLVALLTSGFQHQKPPHSPPPPHKQPTPHSAPPGRQSPHATPDSQQKPAKTHSRSRAHEATPPGIPHTPDKSSHQRDPHSAVPVGETAETGGTMPLIPGQIGSAKIKINTRPPIQFVPFELNDIQNRMHQVVTLSSTLSLKTGAQMAVSQYLDQINAYEREFNALGHTLRGEPRIIELQELEPESDLLPATTGEDTSGNTVAVKTVGELERAFRDEPGSASNRGQVLAGLPPASTEPPPSLFRREKDAGPPEYKLDDSVWGRPRPGSPLDKPPTPPPPQPPGTIGKPRPFFKRWGIPGFRVLVKGRIDNWGSTSTARVKQETSAEAIILGWSVKLMTLQSSLNAPRVGNLNPEIKLVVQGKEKVLSGENVSGTEWTKSGGEESGEFVDLNKTFRFSIGPIPASVTIGVRGNAGIRSYWAGMRPLYAKAQYRPFIGAKLYAKGGPDLGIVKFGVREELNLLEYEITLASECILKAPKLEKFLWEEYSATGALSTLGGRFSVFACVDMLLGDVCFEQTLSSWRGYSLSNSEIIPFDTNSVNLLQWLSRQAGSTR